MSFINFDLRESFKTSEVRNPKHNLFFLVTFNLYEIFEPSIFSPDLTTGTIMCNVFVGQANHI